MTDIVYKLRIKHTLYTAITSGIILAALLGGFFGLIYGAAEFSASRAMDAALSDSADRPPSMGSSRCFVFYVVNNHAEINPIYTNDIAFYSANGYDIDEIIRTAVEVYDGNFKVDDKYFSVASDMGDPIAYYAVYDRTADRNLLMNTALIVISMYFIALMLVCLLAYLFSAKTTAPLKEAMQRQRDLVANASHELKTPLTIIATNLSVMKSEPDSTIADNSKWVDTINGQIDRMDGLIKNMLELSKLENSAIPKRIVNFSQLAEGVCLEFEPLCFEHGVRLITEIKPKLLVYGEKNSLERLIVILLDNALKYCGNNGKIGCKLHLNGKKIHLTVMNTGAAISTEEAKHVFDRFYRSDGARENPDGNSFGLGLSIAQATVLAHKGTISCHGVDNKGSVFEVFLPLPSKKQLNTMTAPRASRPRSVSAPNATTAPNDSAKDAAVLPTPPVAVPESNPTDLHDEDKADDILTVDTLVIDKTVIEETSTAEVKTHDEQSMDEQAIDEEQSEE